MGQSTRLSKCPSLDRYGEHFGDATDTIYLRVHYPRFRFTKDKAAQRWYWDNAQVLDIGAHWLHQSLLYAIDGCRLVAADFAETLDQESVRDLASKHNIELYPYRDLSSETVFDSLPENSIDVVLFCEIIEHITFNPVGMWKAIYRVLRPGGRIIVTTPNYYRWENIKKSVKRFLGGGGTGISIEEILETPTYGPHWKEFSIRELKAYFGALSPDFEIGTAMTTTGYLDLEHLNWKGLLRYHPDQALPQTRQMLYMEVNLPEKSAGITVRPGWYDPDVAAD